MATVTVRSSREEECRRLKAELQFLRRKGALRTDWDPNSAASNTSGSGGLVGVLGSGLIGGMSGSGTRACARCRAELGRIINRGALCRACRLRVCKACREYNVRATDWVCSVCHKHMEIQVATGEWMNEFVRRPSRRRDNRVYVPAADIVKRSIRRSWTISTSHRRSFGGPQGSPELRAYSSLPRGVSYRPSVEADTAEAARRATEECPPHRRLPTHPLLCFLRRGSSGGKSGKVDVEVPTRRCLSQDEDAILPVDPSSMPKSVFEAEKPKPDTSPGRRGIGRKAVSLRRQHAVSSGSAGSAGEMSSEGEVPKSPRERVGEDKDAAIKGGKVEKRKDDPVEDFDVEPLSGTIFRKVTIKKKRKAVEVEDGEDEAGVVGTSDAGRSTPSIVAPSITRSELLQHHLGEAGRRLGGSDSPYEGSGSHATLLLDYVLDDGKIHQDGEDYKLVFISSDSSSNSEVEEDCDWDYFEPSRSVRGDTSVSRDERVSTDELDLQELMDGRAQVVSLSDHIFLVESVEGQRPCGNEGGGPHTTRFGHRTRRVGRSRSETDLARLHLHLSPVEDSRSAGVRSGGFVIDEGPTATILAAGEFGSTGMEGTGIRMWTLEREDHEYGSPVRTIIPIPVPVPVQSWPQRFTLNDDNVMIGGAHSGPRSEAGGVADIVYLGPAGSNAVKIRIRSFQRSSSSRLNESSVSQVSVVSPSPDSWYAWHRVSDANVSTHPTAPSFGRNLLLLAPSKMQDETLTTSSDLKTNPAVEKCPISSIDGGQRDSRTLSSTLQAVEGYSGTSACNVGSENASENGGVESKSGAEVKLGNERSSVKAASDQEIKNIQPTIPKDCDEDEMNLNPVSRTGGVSLLAKEDSMCLTKEEMIENESIGKDGEDESDGHQSTIEIKERIVTNENEDETDRMENSGEGRCMHDTPTTLSKGPVENEEIGDEWDERMEEEEGSVGRIVEVEGIIESKVVSCEERSESTFLESKDRADRFIDCEGGGADKDAIGANNREHTGDISGEEGGVRVRGEAHMETRSELTAEEEFVQESVVIIGGDESEEHKVVESTDDGDASKERGISILEIESSDDCHVKQASSWDEELRSDADEKTKHCVRMDDGGGLETGRREVLPSCKPFFETREKEKVSSASGGVVVGVSGDPTRASHPPLLPCALGGVEGAAVGGVEWNGEEASEGVSSVENETQSVEEASGGGEEKSDGRKQGEGNVAGMGDGRPSSDQQEKEILPCDKTAFFDVKDSEGEDSVAAVDSDDGDTSSGEFDLASGQRWASTPPSSNSDAAVNSEESDSDDENFSRVFVVNPVEYEEDEGLGRGEEGRDGGEGGVVKLEGAVLPYGGAGVRLMNIRTLTEDDVSEKASNLSDESSASPSVTHEPPQNRSTTPNCSDEVEIDVEYDGKDKGSEKLAWNVESNSEDIFPDFAGHFDFEDIETSSDKCSAVDSDEPDRIIASYSKLSEGASDKTTVAKARGKEEGCDVGEYERTNGVSGSEEGGGESVSGGDGVVVMDTDVGGRGEGMAEGLPAGESGCSDEGESAVGEGGSEGRDEKCISDSACDISGHGDTSCEISEIESKAEMEDESSPSEQMIDELISKSDVREVPSVEGGGEGEVHSQLLLLPEGEGGAQEDLAEGQRDNGLMRAGMTREESNESCFQGPTVVNTVSLEAEGDRWEKSLGTEVGRVEIVQDQISLHTKAAAEQVSSDSEGDETKEEEEQCLSAEEGEADKGTRSEEGSVATPAPCHGNDVSAVDSVFPSEMALAIEFAAEVPRRSDERPEEEGSDLVPERRTPASAPSTPPSSPPLRRSSLPTPLPPPGETVDGWKVPSEDARTGGWGPSGGGRASGEGRCVSLEDILHPETRAIDARRSFGGSSESAISTSAGTGGGVYTSYVMITQDGGSGLICKDSGDALEVSESGGEELGVLSESGVQEEAGRHQRVNVSVVEVSVVTSETTTLVSEEEEEEDGEEEEEDGMDDCEISSDERGVVLKHVNWGEEKNNNTGLAGYFTLTLETGTASPTPPRRPEIKRTIELKDPSGLGNGLIELPLFGGDMSDGESSLDSDGDAVKVVTGGDTLSAVVCLEEGLADDDSWVEEVDATVDDIQNGEDEEELGSESVSSGDEAYFDREEELRGYNRAIDFTLHTILEESGEDSEVDNQQTSTQLNKLQSGPGGKQKADAANADADASELEKYYFFHLGGIKGGHSVEEADGQECNNEESEISDTISETSCSSIYSEGLDSLGVAGTPGHDGITEMAESILGLDASELGSSRLEKYFISNILALEPPMSRRAPLGDEDGFSENTDESGSVGSDSEGRPSPEQRRKRLVRARGAGRQHHNSGGSGGGAASDAEAVIGSPAGTGTESLHTQQSNHTHSQVHHHQQQQKLLGQAQQQPQIAGGTQGDLGEGESSSTESDSFDETAFEKSDGQFDTVKRKKKKRKESRLQDGDIKEESVNQSGEEHDDSRTPLPDLATVAEEDEPGGEEREDIGNQGAIASLGAENSSVPGDHASTKQPSRDSGFIGSCDDLLKDQQQQRASDGEQRSSSSDKDSKMNENASRENHTSNEVSIKKTCETDTQVPMEGDVKSPLDVIGEAEVAPMPAPRPVPSGSPASISRTSLSRKDSFNNWSSDEETNLMMSKMRAFFKTMVAGKMASVNSSSGLRRSLSNSSRQGNAADALSASSSTSGDIVEPAEKVKPPQLVYFENELTRLMKTVPGIRDEQVREIVEYLSSEETWSDSYDSSDYTSSDLEGAGYHVRGPSGPLRTELQQQISASCQQIIRNFDNCTIEDIEDDESFTRQKNSAPSSAEAVNKETAFVYQRLVASFGKVTGGVGEPASSDTSSTPHSSPPLIAKVMHHIGGRLVALMHQVSAAGSVDGPLSTASSPSNHHNLSVSGSPKTGNNQVAAAMAARYRRLLRREAAAASKEDKGSVTSTSVESECPSTDTEERSVDSDADSSSSSPPPIPRLPSLPRSKSHDLGQWQRLLLSGDGNRRVNEAHSYYYGVSGVGSSIIGGTAGSSGSMMSSGVHSGGVGGKDNKESLRSSSSGVSDLAEEREEYERLSWRGSFESALAADSRTKLSMEAKRRSAGSGSGSASDLCSSNDQLDHRGRVRSCGSITSAGSRGSLLQQQLGARARLSASGGDLLAYRSSRGTVAEEHEGEGDDEGDGDTSGSTGALARRRRSVPDAKGPPGERSTTLPRINTAVSASTNSLPRLPTASGPPHGTAAAAIQKSQSLMSHHVHQQPHHHHHLFLQNVKSARYRPPGFRPPTVPPVAPKRAVSVPGLNHRSKGERRRQSSGDDTLNALETTAKGMTPTAVSTTSTVGSAPSTPAGGKKVGPSNWASTPPLSPSAGANSTTEDESGNDRLQSAHQQSTTLSSLGLRSDSMASVYSGAGEGRYGTVAVRGEVEFALQYNYKQGALEVLVKQCRELAPVDIKRNRSDPYVKVYLLPDKSKSGKRKTKVKKHTLNPVFEETLKFHITLNGLETRTLWLTVWHSDMFGRNDFLGEVMMSLENKVFDDPSPKWYPLQERTEPFDDVLCYKGEMIVGLKFVPPDVTNLHKKGRMSRGSLHVLVKDAKNLTAVKGNGTSDPFCKSYLLPDKGRSAKQKTAVCRRSCNPVWNHTFVYEDVSLQELSERSLELTVWDHDRLASNEFLGGLRFNLGTGKHYGKNVDWMDATGREMSLWQSMLERANFWVEGCLTLRPTLDHRSSPLAS